VGVAGKAKQCDLSIMKRRDTQITLRLAGELRAKLEDEAAARGRGLSNLIRQILITHVAQRIVDRTTSAQRETKTAA
jgi:predicted DNA binding CopG/RHH family protein